MSLRIILFACRVHTLRAAFLLAFIHFELIHLLLRWTSLQFEDMVVSHIVDIVVDVVVYYCYVLAPPLLFPLSRPLLPRLIGGLIGSLVEIAPPS